MSTQRINAAEKDLEKFIKFLTLKSVQVVVQSRLGEKFLTECNPLATGNDWFNIVINDNPDVAAETKHALALKPGDSILHRLPVSVEISLKTVDGDQMILEVWSIDLQSPTPTTNNNNNGMQQQTQQQSNKDVVDAAAIKGGAVGNSSEQQLIKASHAIYNRMGILLKSLITLTRTTPAYKLSRRQCPDSYDIYYRVYVDRPQIHTLGEGYKQVRIGQLNTIVGTLSMSVAYRTKMTFTPTTAQTRNGEANAIMVKSDHFRPTSAECGVNCNANNAYNCNGVNHNNNNNNNNNGSILTCMKKGANGMHVAAERKIIDIDKPLRPGAFTDIGKLRQFTEDDYVLPETPPFEWLLQRVRTDSSNYGGSVESLNCKCESPTTTTNPIPFGNGYQQHINIINNNNNNNNALNQNYYINKNNNNNTNNNNNNNNEGNTTIGAAGQQQLSSSRLSQSPPIKSLLVPVPPSTRHMGTISPAPATSQSPSPSSPYSTQANANDDDNLLKELNFPFASSTSHVNDLAKFYRDCYHAPPLRGLGEIANTIDVVNTSSNVSNNNNTSNSSSSCGAIAFVMAADSAAVDDLSRQLEQFETSLEDYDKLVSQFGLSGSSSTGSRSSGGLQMSN